MKTFQKATRSRCKIKMAIQGPSGSGKTYSSLVIAHGITNDWSKIAVIDSENGSANLYADLGPYNVLTLSPPFTPESFTEAIQLAVKNGYECLVIDSLSAEWSGQGGILDIHSNIPGNSFTAWSKVTPRHNAFVQAILQSDIHVIGTMRTKTDYILSDKNGKQVPEKVGMKPTQREDSEYEFTLVLELNQKHTATVGKDRTGLFINKPEVLLNEELGKQIKAWCNHTPEPHVQINEATALPITEDFEQKIMACKTLEELTVLYNDNPNLQRRYRTSFISRKNQIDVLLNSFLNNGIHS